MTARPALVAVDGRLDLERQLLAALIAGGAPALLALRRTPWRPAWLTGPQRLAVEALEAMALRDGLGAGPVDVESVAYEVRRAAGDDLAAEGVRGAVADAVEAHGGEISPDALERLAGALADAVAEDGAEPAEAPRTRLLSVSDIFDPLPPVNWLCQALDVAPGAPLLVAGYGFSGKTVAVQDLALAVASGTMAWGRLPVCPGRVLHLDYEQGTYLSRLRYQRLARARGVDPRDLDGRLTLAPMPGWYIDGDASDELARLCEGVDLVIVDSFRAACPLTDENSSEARIPLDRLTRISEETGVTAAVVHHARKPTKDSQGGARMSVRGSGALYDACGSVLVAAAEKGQPIRLSHEKARITGRTHGDLLLHIEDVEVDGDPEGGLRVSATDAGDGTPEDPAARFAGVRARVLEAVRAEGTFPGGTTALRVRLGLRKEDVSAAVADLVASGAIQRGGTHRDPTLIAVGSTGTDADEP